MVGTKRAVSRGISSTLSWFDSQIMQKSSVKLLGKANGFLFLREMTKGGSRNGKGGGAWSDKGGFNLKLGIALFCSFLRLLNAPSTWCQSYVLHRCF